MTSRDWALDAVTVILVVFVLFALTLRGCG
jgi:hypothetical protein